MRGTRWLLLVAIAAIIYGVAFTYHKQIAANIKSQVQRQEPLPENVGSASHEVVLSRKNQNTGCKIVDVVAKGMNQASDATHSELSDVKLLIYHHGKDKCDTKYDLVRSAAATFFDSEGRLFAAGEVDITLGEPLEGEPPPSLISIKCSGVTFDTGSGRAETDNPCHFIFKNGEGHATGAIYDPPSKELFMKHDVVVDWKAATPNAKPMHIEAPTLMYRETTAEIDLAPTGKMTRDAMVFEGESPVIRMRSDDAGHKFIKEIDSAKAHGTDVTATRKLTYAADHVEVDYNDEHVVQHIVAEGHAALNSVADASETNVNGNHVEMFFVPKEKPHEKESQLDHVTCDGNAVASSKPLPGPGRTVLADSHVLRSEHIGMKMRGDGKEIETVTAHPSGVIEFLPNQPAGHHRTLSGDEMLINYATQNRVESFHATNVKTTTDPNAAEKARNAKRPASITSSRDFLAKFDPKTNQLTTMEQTGDFNYQEGDRKAKANKATFDQKANVMTLDGKASVSDTTGATDADHIRLDQNTDDFIADGNVKSTRMPDKDSKNNSGMLSGDAPMNAQAQKMESSNRKDNKHTHYQGNVRLWQGANRITADVVDIDQTKHTLIADGHVITEAWEQPKADAKAKSSGAVKTVVNAPHLIYTDQDRLAYYTGGVKLDRSEVHLKSKELHAWLADSDADSQLEKVFADGAVEISGARKETSYVGNSEHLEYFTDEQTVKLNGGTPKLVRTVGGKQPTIIQHPELIYSLEDGNMKGNGPGFDRIPPKKK